MELESTAAALALTRHLHTTCWHPRHCFTVQVLGKAEWLNPGGSIKDRAALFLVKDAEERGLLKPGGTVVEGTAGNTGIGLAHICNAKGYKLIIYMPNTQVCK